MSVNMKAKARIIPIFSLVVCLWMVTASSAIAFSEFGCDVDLDIYYWCHYHKPDGEIISKLGSTHLIRRVVRGKGENCNVLGLSCSYCQPNMSINEIKNWVAEKYEDIVIKECIGKAPSKEDRLFYFIDVEINNGSRIHVREAEEHID